MRRTSRAKRVVIMGMSRRRVTRGGTPRRRTNAPKSNIGRMLQDYYQPGAVALDFNALGSNASTSLALVDNSATYQNAILKWAKLTVRPIWLAAHMRSGVLDTRTFAIGILKQDEDNTTEYNLNNQEAVRELRNDGKILRGPWWYTMGETITSGQLRPMEGHMKPIVLKNFVLDREEDLRFAVSHVAGVAFASTAQHLMMHMKGFVRVIR